MVKEKVIKTVECDMCHNDITNVPQYSVELKGYKWDLCHNCYTSLSLALPFLDITVGLEIKYKFQFPNKEIKTNNDLFTFRFAG